MPKKVSRLEQDEALDEEEEEDEAQPGQGTILQGGNGWPSWLKWGIFLLIVVFLVWLFFLSPGFQAEEMQQEKGQVDVPPQKPEPAPQSSKPATFIPLDQSASPFSLSEPSPNETTTHIWPTENW